jgi:cytochrome c-type biogenesis protein CcmH/NrfF
MVSSMVLLWAVPVVAVAVGVALVLARLRHLEDVATELAAAVRRSREVRAPMADLRDELARTRPLVDGVFAHWEQDET